jgi:hypothetical protein
MTAGYSGTALAKKLGIKEGFTVRLVQQPAYYFDLFTDFPQNIIIATDTRQPKDLIHYFTKDAAALEKDISRLKKEIKPGGMIWVSWPKKASKVATDITEDTVRATALKNGLVDIKVCAVDATWSGLKLVIPLKDRHLV